MRQRKTGIVEAKKNCWRQGMKLKPPTIDRVDRIEIKLVEYKGKEYVKSRTISVYEVTLEGLEQLILKTLQEAER